MWTSQPRTHLWAQTLGQLQARVGQQTYEMWLAPLRVVPSEDFHGLCLSAPNAFSRDWFVAHYQDLVLQTLRELTDSRFALAVEIATDLEPELQSHGSLDTPPQHGEPLSSQPTALLRSAQDSRHLLEREPPRDASFTVTGHLPLPSAIAQASTSSVVTSRSTPTATLGFGVTLQTPTLQRSNGEPPSTAPALHLRAGSLKPIGLSARYHFGTFVTAGSNELAASAAMAAAEAPGQRFNPLFVYGGVGLGKTHLLHAVGHAIHQRQPQLRIVLLSAETFMNEFVTAVRHNQFDSFRARYRDQADVLLVDDIQFIAGRDRTMDEFFHVFNALYEAGRQIMITADRVPADMPGMEARLTSRLNWGLVADVQAPDLETRIAILTSKIERDGLAVPPAACEAIATQVRSNVRELEGALLRVTAHSSLRQVTITPQLVRQILGESAPSGTVLSVELVQKAVAMHFNVRVSDLKGASRTRTVTQPRMIAMYLSRELTNASFPEIGQRFGGKDHTTVMHAYRKIDHLAQSDADLDRTLHSLRERLLPHAS